MVGGGGTWHASCTVLCLSSCNKADLVMIVSQDSSWYIVGQRCLNSGNLKHPQASCTFILLFKVFKDPGMTTDLPIIPPQCFLSYPPQMWEKITLSFLQQNLCI